MKYAVVRISGHQFKVSEGEEILVDKLADPRKVGVEVLLVADGENIKVGKPLVEDAKVVFKVVKDKEPGEKIHVRTFKAKSRYRKHRGFRHQYSRLLVQKIS